MSEKFDFARIVDGALDDISDEKLRAHIESAIKHDRKRQPVLRVNSSRSSARPECGQCGVGIRLETTPQIVNGMTMHPKCARVATDASYALKMSSSSHAARSVHDSKIIPALKTTRDAEREAEHKALLARLENEAIERAKIEKSAS